MAAELAMAAEIARVLGAVGGGHPTKDAETPSTETGDPSSAGEAASSTASGTTSAASPEGSGSPRAASPAESGTNQAPESVPGATPSTTGATPGVAPDMPEARPSAATVGEPQRNGGAEEVDGEVAVVPGVARYHRRRCILIRFMGDTDLDILSREEAEDAGCVACRACQPDED